MSKFICENADCERLGKVEEIFQNRYSFINGRMVNPNAPCPSCKKERKEINENANTPVGEKLVSLPKYSSMTKQQQQEVLKKRSHEHFKKEVKPFKEHQLNQAVQAFKETGKS